MKYALITITKVRTEDTTQFSYPTGFVPQTVDCIYYENDGGDTESVVAKALDNSVLELNGVSELTLEEAKDKIEEFVNGDKDISDERLAAITPSLTRADIITKKQNNL